MRQPNHRSLFAVAFVAASACTDSTSTDPAPEVVVEPPFTEEPQRPPVVYHADGTVETEGRRYDSVVEFQSSPDFILNGRRCATREPRRFLRGAATDCTTSATAIKSEYTPEMGQVFTIPVVFHIIKKTDGTGEIPDALIKSQIDILNEDFNAIMGTLGAGGTDAKVRFALAAKDPNGMPTTGIQRVTNNTYFSQGTGMHQALHWDTKRYLNIYTSSADGALGYATLASESAGDIDDGVVLLHSTVGRDAPMGGKYNKGRTGTHEVGHYLGLLHTFDGGCGSATGVYTTGDLIKDTIAHAEEDYDCAPGPTTCTGGGAKPIENYMNYTPDMCMTKFTPEQVNRIRCSIMNYRKELVMNTDAVGVPPVAKFSATVDGLSATFADESTDADGTVTARNWMFGDGAVSSDQNPTHGYAAAGTYTVTLEVTDNTGMTHSYSAPVTVAVPDPCQSGGANCPCMGADCEADETSGGCCETAGASPSGTAVLMLGVLIALRRRRRRRS
jgi:MYXO-CTERM domain-containing protein